MVGLEHLRFDQYHFLARMRPVFLVALSPTAALLLWTGASDEWLRAIVLALAIVGVPYVFAEMAADEGRKLEQELWKRWGGAPTTAELRYSTSSMNPETLGRLRRCVSRLCDDVVLPSAVDEAENAEAADRVYVSCIDRLRVIFRDEPMVLKANIAYGFRRNTWAIRGWGRDLAFLAGIAGAGHMWIHGFSWLAAAVVVVAIVALVSFRRLSPDWVRSAAQIYAKRLLEAADGGTFNGIP